MPFLQLRCFQPTIKSCFRVFRSIAFFHRKLSRMLQWYYKHYENIVDDNDFKFLVHKKSANIPGDIFTQYYTKWKKLSPVIGLGAFRHHFLRTGKFDLDIVPVNIYFTIVEQLLNNELHSAAFADKALIDWVNGNENIPCIFLRNIHGVYYGANRSIIAPETIDLSTILEGREKVVVKLSITSSRGRGVTMFSRKGDQFVDKNGNVLSINYLNQNYSRDFILQEFVVQHPFLHQLNPSSVNSIRLVTYRSVRDEKIHVIKSVLNVGAKGADVDNAHFGGTEIGISDRGYLRNYGIRPNSGELVSALGEPKLELSSIGTIPGYERACEVAKRMASKHFYSRILGFDAAIDVNGEPQVLEINNIDIGAPTYQGENGALFGPFTDEVIEWCHAEMKRGVNPRHRLN